MEDLRVSVVFEISEWRTIFDYLPLDVQKSLPIIGKIEKAIAERIERDKKEKDPTLCDYCHEKPIFQGGKYCLNCEMYLESL